MTDSTHDCADARPASGLAPSPAITAPPPDIEDPARQVGDVFRRLSACHATYGERGFARIVAAVLVALGRAAVSEAGWQAQHLAEHTAPPPGADFAGRNSGDPD